MKNQTLKLLIPTLLAFSIGMFAPLASAADSAHGKSHASSLISSEEHPFGKQGDPRKASRTITIDMDDSMRFTPSEITVKQGETIRFVVKNSGKLLHEMVIGTMDGLTEIHALIKAHPGMEHDEDTCCTCRQASRAPWSGNSLSRVNSIMLA